LEHAFGGAVATLHGLTLSLRLGESPLRVSLAVLHRWLGAFLVVDDEVHGEPRAVRPPGIGRVRSITDEIAIVATHHDHLRAPGLRRALRAPGLRRALQPPGLRRVLCAPVLRRDARQGRCSDTDLGVGYCPLLRSHNFAAPTARFGSTTSEASRAAGA